MITHSAKKNKKVEPPSNCEHRISEFRENPDTRSLEVRKLHSLFFWWLYEEVLYP